MHLELQQQQTGNHPAASFQSATRGNNVEYLFDRAACKTCSLFGICNHGNDARNLSSSVTNPGKFTRPLQKGDYLFRQGDKVSNIHVIRTGGVKLLFTSHDGTDQILNFYLRGDILGLGDIDSGLHSCSAIALETTSVCKLPYDKLQSICRTQPHLYDLLFKMASREIAHEHSKMVLLGQKQSDERFASFLLDLAMRNSKNGYSSRKINLSMSRHDIAKYLCLADETISRIITKFCNDSLLEVSKRSVHIPDLDQLARKAGVVRRLD